MIIVFPMLVSRAVSENSIPGIAKTLENYLIVHKQDVIMNAVNASHIGKRGKLNMRGGNFLYHESVDLSEVSTNTPAGSRPGTKSQSGSNAGTTGTGSSVNPPDPKKEKWEEEKRRAAKASAKLTTSDMRTISLEPTYITIEVSDKWGNKSTSILGVKVVPYRVKSDVKLSHLILQDSKLNALNGMMVAFGRWAVKKFYQIFDKWTTWLRIMGGLTPSGDPRRDIIMGRTGMQDQAFLVLSRQEDIDEYFLDNISKLNRLFKMGWGHFVVADDIARTAFFCMDTFRGLCNAIPYAMMYDRLGQTKAYESMEDAKKANSSIFKVSARFSRLVGEWKVDQKLLKYSNLNEGINDE